MYKIVIPLEKTKKMLRLQVSCIMTINDCETIQVWTRRYEPQAGDGDQLLPPPYCYSQARSKFPLNSYVSYK